MIEDLTTPDGIAALDARRAQVIFEAAIRSSGRTLTWGEATENQRRDALAAARAIRWSDSAVGLLHSPWSPIATYPMTGPVLRVRVRMADGTIHEDAHWACGDGDGLMPSFEGWFIPTGGPGQGFRDIDTPVEWWPHPSKLILRPSEQRHGGICTIKGCAERPTVIVTASATAGWSGSYCSLHYDGIFKQRRDEAANNPPSQMT